MEKYPANLARLKELVQTADNLGDIYTYFFDHLTNDPGFVSRSKPVKRPLVVQALKTVTAELFQREALADGSLKDIQITKLALLQLGKHPFYHGACFIHGRPVSMLYFEDIDMGMVCVASAFPYMQFARFTCYRVKDLDQNNIFAPGNRTAH